MTIFLLVCLLLPLPIRHAAAAGNDVSVQAVSVGGELYPSFSNNVSDYEVYMDKSSNPNSHIALLVNDNQTKLEYRVNSGTWNSIGNWVSSGNLFMNPGQNLIEAKITSADQTATRMISFHVHRPLPNDSSVRKLTVSEGALSPGFDSANTSYTVNVPYTTSSIALTPTFTDGDASATINGLAAISGQASDAINLNVGSNYVSIMATSADGSTVTTYTVNVIRAAASTNADLSQLNLSVASLLPLFSSGTTSYAAEVANSVSSTTVTPTSAEAHATIQVSVNGGNPEAVISGTASSNLPLAVGDNLIKVQVTAQDGSTVKTYSISLHRRSSNADLSGLSLSAGSLAPSFDSATTEYDVQVPSTASDVTFKPKLADSLAKVEWQSGSGSYISLADNTDSPGIPLQEGLNILHIKVTADDGNAKIYTIRIERQSSNAKLSSLTLSSGTVDPAFDENTFTYNTSVAYTVDSITLNPVVAESHAAAEMSLNHGAYASLASGVDSVPLNLNQGSNTIQIKVTAQSGAEQIYSIIVNRGYAPTSPPAPTPNPPAQPVSFNDTAGHWAEKLIIDGAEQGWISGFPDGSFRPDQQVTREDFAVIVTKALGLHADTQAGSHTFSDQADIAPYAVDAINLAYQKGLITGYEDGSFRPNAEITRMEMAVILMRTVGEQAATASTGFADDSHIASWAKPFVKAARDAGIANGRGTNRFTPLAAATRAEAVTMVLHLLEYNKSH
ncbi:cadherin-like beta sandwich domain-containing protein [Paenibacillus sp. MMO-177]|uniref:cadherin-like beta sandwich domain-containing protein n=1 Tax=Paenibacillus sp. MMO-177 TaxID=3081289 RepID=UPI00301719C6